MKRRTFRPASWVAAGDAVAVVARLSPFHEGEDLRRKPYLLARLPIDAGPVRLV